MKYFIEVTLLHNRDISLRHLWSKIYDQLHLRLVVARNIYGQTNIGVSFPEYQSDIIHNIQILGCKLRVFAPTKSILEQINLPQYLKSWLDYIHITSIREIPNNIDGYAIYKRKRIHGELAIGKKIMRLATYKAIQENITYEKAIQGYQHWSTPKITLPYLYVNSASTEQSVRFYIEQIKVDQPSINLSFSSYGLSPESTVPEF